MERGGVSRKKLRILVLDEADRMLDMGFKLPVDRIVAKIPQDRQTVAFSATLEGRPASLPPPPAIRSATSTSPKSRRPRRCSTASSTCALRCFRR